MSANVGTDANTTHMVQAAAARVTIQHRLGGHHGRVAAVLNAPCRLRPWLLLFMAPLTLGALYADWKLGESGRLRRDRTAGWLASLSQQRLSSCGPF
jgi:hypothetical protein